MVGGCWRGSRCGIPGDSWLFQDYPCIYLDPRGAASDWSLARINTVSDRRGRVSSNTTDERCSHLPESITPVTADCNYTNNAIIHVWQSVVKKPRERTARFWISYGRNQSPVSHASNGCEGRPVRNENESPPAAGSMGSTVGNDCLLGSWKFMAFL